MKLTIHGHHLHLPTATTEHLTNRLSFALDRHERRVSRVEAYLNDANGPRGGIDKQCRLVVYLRARQPVVITDSDSGWEALFSRVADRAGQAVSRRSDRDHRGSRVHAAYA
jgi:ribosome-associated translation inhibitor RaiA